MSAEFIYITPEGKVLKTVDDFLPAKGLPPETWEKIVGYMDLFSKLNFSLTSKGAYDQVYRKAGITMREAFLACDFTEVTRLASKSSDLKKYLMNSLHLRPLPLSPKYSLFSHQMKSLVFMKKRESSGHKGIYGGIIQMEMGLGKSLAALAHSLTSLRPKCKEKYGEGGFPTLIVASKTVMREWKSEGVSKFFGDRIKVLYLHKDCIEKDAYNSLSRQKIVTYDIVITTYDVVRSVAASRDFTEEILERCETPFRSGCIISVRQKTRRQANKSAIRGPGVLFGTPWERVFADESQIFANPRTKTYKAMMAIYGRYKWCLTGTPIRNYETDIWAQLRWCGYNGVDRARDWYIYGATKMVAHKLNNVIFKMDYTSAGIGLPPKKEHRIEITLTGMEKEIYDYAHGVSVEIFNGMLAKKFSYSHVLAVFIRMRQCCIAPYLITDKSKRKASKTNKNHLKEAYRGKYAEWIIDRDTTAGIESRKVTAILNIFKNLPKGEKILVFSTFTSALDLVAYACQKKMPNFGYLQVDGSTPGEDREKLFNKFRFNSKYRGLFLSYKIGSEGLNLTQATHIICIEPWWTKSVYHQAVSRSWRYGQTKTVHVYNILVKDSIEDKILEMCDLKEKMALEYLKGSIPRLDVRTMGEFLGVY